MKLSSPQRLLKQALAEHLDWHGARLSFLAHFILALFQVRTVNLAEIAQAFSGRVKPESNYRRLQRFFQQFAIDYAAVARLVVRLASVGEGPWYLTLDRTNWQFGRCHINVLMLGIAHRGVAVPLLWTLLPHSGNSATHERIELMERFLALFGRERIRALLADREFVGADGFAWLQHQHIPFRIRLKHNTRIANRHGVRLPASRLFAHLAVGEQRLLPEPRRLWESTLHVIGLRLDDGQLLLVATTDSPPQALADYARRWEIESLFAALKKRGFRFEDTHLTDPRRIRRLIALLAIAFAWAHHTGEVLSHQQPIPFKKLSADPSRLSSVMASTSSATSCLTFRTSLNSSTGC